MRTETAFSQRLHQLRLVRRLSLRRLAELAALNHIRLLRLEHGAPPRDAEVLALADALDVPPAELRIGGGQ